MDFCCKMFFAISKESVNRLSANIPNEVTFRRYSFLKAQSYIIKTQNTTSAKILLLPKLE